MEVRLTATVPHVRLRDGVYQYERRVPLDIVRDARRFSDLFGSKPLFRRSLRTKDTGEMLTAARQVHHEFELLIGRTRLPTPVTVQRPVARPALRPVTDADLKDVQDRYFDVMVRPFERLQRQAAIDPLAAEELERVVQNLEYDGEAIVATLTTLHNPPDGPCLNPIEEAIELTERAGFDAPSGSEALGALICAVRTGLFEGFGRKNQLARGEVAPSIRPYDPRQEQTPVITLRQAVDRYIAARTPPAKAQSETRLALQQFEAVAGNKPVAAISRNDVNGFADHLANMKVGGRTAGSVERFLSPHTIGKRLRMLSAAVTHAKDRGWISGDNLLAQVRVKSFAKPLDKSVMPDKRRLQVEELNLIFAHPWFTGCKSASETHLPGTYRLQGCEYWGPVMAVLTGCRAAELGGMKVDEVRLEGSHPHLIIRDNEYRRTKSKRTRCVPVSDALLELGFADYVASVRAKKSDRLFPDWTASIVRTGADKGFPAWSNARIIRAFNRTVIPQALEGRLPAGARQEVTFHSMRGAFKSMLANTNRLPSNIVNEVIGHAKDELDERYIGEITIEETYPAVRGCRYTELALPTSPIQQTRCVD